MEKVLVFLFFCKQVEKITDSLGNTELKGFLGWAKKWAKNHLKTTKESGSRIG